MSDFSAGMILKQLGGNRFIAMTGAKNFVKNDEKQMISFQLPRAEQGIKYVRITLNSMDTYNIEFIKMVKGDIKVIKKVDGVYDDQLQEIFTRETGLNTHL